MRTSSWHHLYDATSLSVRCLSERYIIDADRLAFQPALRLSVPRLPAEFRTRNVNSQNKGFIFHMKNQSACKRFSFFLTLFTSLLVSRTRRRRISVFQSDPCSFTFCLRRCLLFRLRNFLRRWTEFFLSFVLLALLRHFRVVFEFRLMRLGLFLSAFSFSSEVFARFQFFVNLDEQIDRDRRKINLRRRSYFGQRLCRRERRVRLRLSHFVRFLALGEILRFELGKKSVPRFVL